MAEMFGEFCARHAELKLIHQAMIDLGSRPMAECHDHANPGHCHEATADEIVSYNPMHMFSETCQFLSQRRSDRFLMPRLYLSLGAEWWARMGDEPSTVTVSMS